MKAAVILLVVAINLVGFFLCPQVALADPAAPDALQILDVEVFRHLVEDDDYLMVFLFNIEYASPPDDPANDLFMFRMTSGTTTIGDSLPYTYGMDGYQYGISGMYFPSSGSATWGSLYTVRIDGNPAVWVSPPTVSYTMLATDYSSASGQADNRSELSAWIVNAVQDLEVNWSVPGELITITNIGTILTAEGQHYMLGAIPGLMAMAPSIFAIKYHDVEWPDATWSDDRAADTEARFDDTTLEKFQESLTNAFGGVDSVYITTVITIIGVLVLMALSFRKWGTTEPVYGLVPLVLLLGSKIDFFPWELYGLFVFACAAYIGYIVIGKYASG